MSISRRGLVGTGIASAMGALGAVLGKQKKRRGGKLRPPGAKPPGEFESACTRCFKCGDACPNDCIKYQGLKDGVAGAFTPYIEARDRGCTLCGECAKVCPTGALQEFEDGREGWLAGVDMGTARVNEGMCYSFHGRTCGACYRACPLAGQALKNWSHGDPPRRSGILRGLRSV